MQLRENTSFQIEYNSHMYSQFVEHRGTTHINYAYWGGLEISAVSNMVYFLIFFSSIDIY